MGADTAVTLLADAVTPVTQAITFAVIGAVVTVLTLVLQNRGKRLADQHVTEAAAAVEAARRSEKEAAEAARRSEKEEDRQALIDKEQRDYARQDLVAERVEAATTAALRKLKDVEDVVAVTRDVVDITHALVNSDKTAALKREVRSMRSTLLLMREVADLKNSAGQFPSAETTAAMTELEVQIQETQSAIDDRLAEQTAAEQRIELDKTLGTAEVAAADKQVAAAEVQQVAASQQQAAADQVSAALGQTQLPPPPPPPR